MITYPIITQHTIADNTHTMRIPDKDFQAQQEQYPLNCFDTDQNTEPILNQQYQRYRIR